MSYPNVDPYFNYRGRDTGIDAKVVIMGNTGVSTQCQVATVLADIVIHTGVGKTSLVQRYTENTFSSITTTSTTGASFVKKNVNVGNLKVRLQIWDTAGQERFRSMAPMYYRGAHAALLVYDITNGDSFKDVKVWLEELRRNCASDLIIYIVGAKADLAKHRAVSPDRARHSLHTWFPPPRSPTPPPPIPAPIPTTMSYMRPRFTSLASSASAPFSALSMMSGGNQSSATSTSSTTARIAQSKTMNSIPQTRPENVGQRRDAWERHNDPNHVYTDDEDPEEEGDDETWGLRKGMEIYEVSAKDDAGVERLFNSLVDAIIKHRHVIEKEKAARERDSVMLTAPTWSAVVDEEERRARERAAWGSCC